MASANTSEEIISILTKEENKLRNLKLEYLSISKY